MSRKAESGEQFSGIAHLIEVTLALNTCRNRTAASLCQVFGSPRKVRPIS
jgi:hypothetical protein